MVTMNQKYIDLLKKMLIDYQHIGRVEYHPLETVRPNRKTALLYPINRMLKKRNFTIAKIKPVTAEERLNGYDWPASAFTMIGLNRLDNIEFCMKHIAEKNIPGDFIETGVWRGGSTMLMKALMDELGMNDRFVWLADSFEGLPEPDTKYFPYSKDQDLHKQPLLSTTQEEVKANFEHFNLLDDRVKFLKGWFKDTLPSAPMASISLLRLDGDLYESTYVALKHLYPKVSTGGFVIVDDYNAFPYCKKAVDDFRSKHNIKTPMITIDLEAVYWQKS